MTDTLNAEEKIHDLLNELEKLKSAIDQIGEVKNGAQEASEASRRVIRKINNLIEETKNTYDKFSQAEKIVNKGEAILNELEKIEFTQHYEKIESGIDKNKVKLKESTKKIINQNNNNFRETNQLIQEKIDDSIEGKLEEISDNYETISKSNKILKLIIIISLFVNIASFIVNIVL